MKREPAWLDPADVRVFHAFLIAEFGGADGVRDETLLESAVARPRHRFSYEDVDLSTWRRPTRTASRAIIRSSTATGGRRSRWRACSSA